MSFSRSTSYACDSVRRGFTLVELLVVIAIIGVLVALLLPAVQQARESARRMQCTNNLKQIGLAVHNFHDTYGHFPYGGRDGHHVSESTNSCCRSKTVHGFNWTFRILPFLEQGNIFELASEADDPDPASGDYHPAEDLVSRSAVTTYYCPTRRAVTAYEGGHYRTDYAGNAGQRSSGSRRVAANRGHRGVFRQTDSTGAKLTIERIRDGSSNVIMVAEKALHDAAHGIEGGDNERYSNAGWDECVTRHGAHDSGVGLPPIPDSIAPNPNNGWQFGQPGLEFSGLFGEWHSYFGSSHSGGVNACLADGSVRFIAFTVEAEAFRRVSLVDSKLPNTLDQ